MSEFIKWKIEDGEEYPIVNRILMGIFFGIGFCCIFLWPYYLIIGLISVIVWGVKVFSDDTKIIIFFLCLAPILVCSIGGFISSKTKPYSGSGVYTPGSCPNPHKYQSSKWYQHEAMMDRERRAQKGRDKDG